MLNNPYTFIKSLSEIVPEGSSPAISNISLTSLSVTGTSNLLCKAALISATVVTPLSFLSKILKVSLISCSLPP